MQEVLQGLDADSKAALALIYMRNDRLESPIELQSSESEAIERVRCEFAFTRAAGSETARDNGFATYSSPAPRESVVGFRRGISA